MTNTIHYHAGSNEAGYLPNSEPDCFAEANALRDARIYLAEEMLRDAEAASTWCDYEGEDEFHADTCGPCGTASALESASLWLEHDATDDDTAGGWSDQIGGRVYWIERATEAECEPEPVRSPWPSTPKMTRQHFAYIARVIAELSEGADLAEHFAYHLADTNGRFDRERFLSAAS